MSSRTQESSNSSKSDCYTRRVHPTFVGYDQFSSFRVSLRQQHEIPRKHYKDYNNVITSTLSRGRMVRAPHEVTLYAPVKRVRNPSRADAHGIPLGYVEMIRV